MRYVWSHIPIEDFHHLLRMYFSVHTTKLIFFIIFVTYVQFVPITKMKKINFVAHAQFELVTKNIKKIIFVAHVHAVMETKIFFLYFCNW
jgi:hypothetical protein